MADAIDYAPLIKKLAQQGVTPEEISRQFGTPIDYTRQVLGLPDLSKQTTTQTKKEPAVKKPPQYRPPTKKKPVVWTDDHQDWLEKAVADGMDYNTIAERLDVPKSTIIRKAAILKQPSMKEKLPKPKPKYDGNLDKVNLKLPPDQRTPETPETPEPATKRPVSQDHANDDDHWEKTKKKTHGIVYNTMQSVVTKGLQDNLGILGGHIAHRLFHGHHGEGEDEKGHKDAGDAEIMEKVNHDFDGLTHQINVATGLMLDSLDDTLHILKHMNLGDRYNSSDTDHHGDLSGPLGTLHPEARKTVLGKLGMILKTLGIGGAALGALGLGAMTTSAIAQDSVPPENTPPEPVPEPTPPPVPTPTTEPPKTYTPPVDKVSTAATPEEAAIRAKDEQEKEANEVYKELKFKADEIEFKADKIIFNQKEGSLVGGSPGAGLGGAGEPGGGEPDATPFHPDDKKEAPTAPSNEPGGASQEKLIDDHHGKHDDPSTSQEKLIDDHHGSHSDPQQPHATRAGAPPSSSPSTQGPGGYSPPAPPASGPAEWSPQAASGVDSSIQAGLDDRDNQAGRNPGFDPLHSPHAPGDLKGGDVTPVVSGRPDIPVPRGNRKASPDAKPVISGRPDVPVTPDNNKAPPDTPPVVSGRPDAPLPYHTRNKEDKPDSFQMGRASIDQAIEGTSPLLKGKYNEAPEPVPPPPPQQPDATPAPPTPPPVPTTDPITKLPTQNGLVGGIGYGGLSAPISPTFFNRQYGGGTAPPNPPFEAPNQQVSPPNQQPVDQVPGNNQLSPSEQDFQDQTNAMTSSLQPADITPSRSGDTLNMLSLQNQVASDTSGSSRGDAMTTSHRGGSAGHGKSRHTDPDAMAHEMLDTYFHDHFANIEGLDPHTINWGIG